MHNHLAKIAEQYDISEIYVFGSRAKEIAARAAGNKVEEDHPDSDVDIGIETLAGKRLSAREKVLFSIAIEDLLQVFRVDLVVISEASPFLALEVIKGNLLYCKDRDEQSEHELFVLRRAGDLAYYEKIRRKQVLEGRQ